MTSVSSSMNWFWVMVLLMEKRKQNKNPSLGSSAGIFTYNNSLMIPSASPPNCVSRTSLDLGINFFSPKFQPRRFGQVALVTKKGQAITLRSTDGQQPQSNLVAWKSHWKSQLYRNYVGKGKFWLLYLGLVMPFPCVTYNWNFVFCTSFSAKNLRREWNISSVRELKFGGHKKWANFEVRKEHHDPKTSLKCQGSPRTLGLLDNYQQKTSQGDHGEIPVKVHLALFQEDHPT